MLLFKKAHKVLFLFDIKLIYKRSYKYKQKPLGVKNNINYISTIFFSNKI